MGIADDDSRYRRLVDSITDYAVYMLDPTGIVSSWNAGAQHLKGYTAEEILGHNFSSFYTPEDQARGLPARVLATSVREGKFEGEGWRVRKDGLRFWAHVIIDPIRDEAGRLIGFAKVTRDLTERKNAEESLRRSEEQFRLLVQGVTDYAIFMLSPEGIVTNWNAGAERIKGYAPFEIIGKHFSTFYSEEDQARGEPQKALDTVLREGKFETEAWRVRKDRTRFWSHVVIDPIRDPDGKLLGFAKITRDVTERRNAQQSLEQTREELFQAQKLEAIGQLTGGVAHDFNNLLMAVLGSLELLKKHLPPDPQNERLLENAMLGAARGSVLTQRMLAFARRQPLDSKPLDLVALLRGMTDLLQRSIGSSMSIETVFPLALPQAVGDANQVELAILNLVLNARDALTDGGTIQISARVESVARGHKTRLQPDQYVCLSVIDTGEGMTPATLARATEPFFTTKGAGKGTGLGLAMVHGLAEQMRGRLRLTSKRGVGTTAEIWLPVAVLSPKEIEPKQIHELQVATRPLRVLAVDDDALVLFNTAAMLEDLGHTVVEARSGTEALKLLGSQSFDLVVTDQAMPNMTGMQLIESIRAQWPQTKVILATGYDEVAGAAKASVPRLLKPFTEAALSHSVSMATRD